MRNSIAMNQVKRYFFVTFCLFFSVFSVFAHTDQCVCKNYYDEELEAIMQTEGWRIYYNRYLVVKQYTDSIKNFKSSQRLPFFLIDPCFFYENAPQYVKPSGVYGSIYSLRFDIASCATDIESLQQIVAILKKYDCTYCNERNMTIPIENTFYSLLNDRLTYLKKWCQKKSKKKHYNKAKKARK